MAQKKRKHGGWQDRLVDYVIRALIWSALRLPVKRRLRAVGWLVRRVIGPAVKWDDRVRANLDHVWPGLPEARIREITNQVLDNVGRAFIENYDVPEMLARGARYQVSGPGLAAVEQARRDGTPVLFVSGHYGSAECARCAMVARGYQIGGLIRPMSNPFFNEHYTKNMHDICEPVFEQGRRGTMGLIKHIKSGGMAVLLFDIYDSSGVPIDFLGQPAPTVTSIADIALKTGALVVPFFGVRHPDRYGFDAIFEEPIPHGDPVEMMQEATRRLEARINADPGQWMWIHRRWKPERQARNQRKRAAAKISP
ncbi:lysophospholipid acyltransferase family protein [Tropicibacter naphthalenivorans]|uniref:Lipid A biosynthesis lauroyl acyltransferase n=1 Tax=Tropicibacter naphthalenivorans TaxID=441103 RepID=A0A0N7LZ53_9RHOB|nr:lysophospholipid acyltransferase family protein [Tropicibacter naphthalenivorans]CUH76705.1 Lipid A biosynthesis lauroyl acyltransferase [Tropicibacter naphthalenivorans]SMC63619.1 KDO2-lipid IV(A) lauroyltransferase [Tropicibacter naphthalenivorans]